ncbi:MAG: mechanosensitive ion channel family protein [Oscillospiraceae bacterium]|jgi:small-conductance mechanosensitive channel|nr:mechanosensitive ion channel family protein [Oscillospiraceae bacterium]
MLTEFFELLGANASLAALLNSVAGIVLKLAIAVALWRLLSFSLKKLEQRSEHLRQVIPPIRRVLEIAALVVAAIFLLSDGISSGIQTVIASSGIAAVVIGIACQDTLGNLFAGLILQMTRPFVAGDTIRYVDADIAGKVEQVTFRHTVIRTFENKQLIIPNSTLSKSLIENYTSGDSAICIIMDFGIEYGSDVENAVERIRFAVETVFGEREFAVDGLSVLVDKLDDSAIVLRLRVMAPSLGVLGALKSEINLKVIDEFATSGVSFAYPHITISRQ